MRYHAISKMCDRSAAEKDDREYPCRRCGHKAELTEAGLCPECDARMEEILDQPKTAGTLPGVDAGADSVMKQLSPDDIEYAADPARGEFRGFAALHDLMDANMLLPSLGMDENDERFLEYANAVMDEVTRRIVAAGG